MAAKKPPAKKSGKTAVAGGRGKTVPKRPVAKPMTAAQKVAARKAVIVKKSKVAKAVASPAKFAGSAKVKTTAYGKMKKDRKESNIEKAARIALMDFSPAGMAMHGIVAAIQAATGRNLDKSPYDKNGKWIGAAKGSRLGGVTDLALYAAPYGKLNSIRKARKAANALRLGEEITKAGKNMKRQNTAIIVNKKKAIYGG